MTLLQGRVRVRDLILCAAATGIAYVAVGALRQWAERRRLVDVPNPRSSHTRPTPRGGGLAIVAITLGGGLVGPLIGEMSPGRSFLAYAAGATVVAGVSWIDDLRTLSTRIRFVAHAIGAAVALWALGWWTVIPAPGLGTLPLGWAGLPITLFWLIGLTNAYNFMDGIDGIAGGQAVVAGLGWAGLGILGGEPLVSALGLLIAGSSLGFLVHNWPPARIFMGDVGSAFLGYSFAALPLLLAHLAVDPVVTRRAPILGVLMVWPFVFDAGFTFLRRVARRENVLEAHRSHLYQRLVIAGQSHRHVTVLYMVLAASGAAAAVVLARTDRFDGFVGVAVLLAAAALVAYVRRAERYSPAGMRKAG